METSYHFSEIFSREFLSIPIIVHSKRRDGRREMFAKFCGCSTKKGSVISAIVEYSAIGEKIIGREELESVLSEKIKKFSSFFSDGGSREFTSLFTNAIIGMIYFEGEIALTFSKRLGRYIYTSVCKKSECYAHQYMRVEFVSV